MPESNSAANLLPRVPEFYLGKTVFLTGAAGFVGSVLLECLLRHCPGIKTIYILLRTKKNVQPEERKEQIFNKKVFEKLKNETPELLGKVCVISGDVSLPDLGMNETDTHVLLQEVSIVFHCAAAVNFALPLEFLLKNNVLSVNNVIELCRKARKFEVLVYTSTAYSNCNHVMFPLKEEVYRLPFHAKQFLDALKNEDKGKLEELISHCKPDWPNWYNFSKCLAENVIVDTASDLPVAIIRPSIVISTWKHPVPGYLEDYSGMSAMIVGAGKGFLKVGKMYPDCKLNLVPADTVANLHVLAAWSVSTRRCVPTLVINCTATENLQVSTRECTTRVMKMTDEYPMPQSFDKHRDAILVRNKYLYFIFASYYHYLPAIVLDGLLKILGKKPRIYSLYRFLDKVMNQLDFFTSRSFQFDRNNIEHLDQMIHPKDKDLSLDFRKATFQEMLLSLPEGSPIYDWTRDKKTKQERQRTIRKRHILIGCIQGVFLVISCLFIYWVFSSIF